MNNTTANQSKSIGSKKKLIFSLILVLLPILFFIILEVSLRALNYGQNYQLFQNYELYGKEYYKFNPEFGKKYFYNLPFMSPGNDIFLKEKPKNGYRVFVIGSSTAAGFPYSRGIMFSRILEARLRDTYPDKHIEVVNTAITAINSYKFQDKIDELIDKEPDAILIYAGHNEFYGGLGIASKEALGRVRWVKILHLNLLDFRIYQFLREMVFGTQRLFMGNSNSDVSVTGTMMQKVAADKDIEYNSSLYKLGHEHYRKNMSTILKKCKRNGISVFYSDMVSNIKDLPPLGSSESNNYPRAIDVYKEGLKLAEAGDFAKAKTELYRAKDLDCIRFRASEDINSIIEDLSKEFGSYFIPMKKTFEENSPNGLIGDNLITEHLHPNIDGYFLMADAFYKGITSSNVIGKFDSANFKSSAYYRKNWGFTELDSLSVDINIRKLKGGWPFKPDTVVNNFIANYKPHGMVDSIAYQAVRYSDITAESAHRYLAKVYIAQDSPQKAVQEYLANIRIEPYKLDNYIDAGNLLFQTGEHEEALKIFLDALRINRDIYILSKLGEIYTATKDYRKAISYLEETVKTDPEFNKQKVLGLLYDAYEQTGETTKANKILSENKDLLTQRKPADNKNEVILRVPEEISELIKEAYKNLKSGNTNKGLELLNKANKIQETGLANRIIGEILLQKKDVKSLEYFKKAYRDYGTDAKFLNTLCYAFIYFKEFESAKKVLIELKQLSPNNPNIPRYEKSISMRYNQL